MRERVVRGLALGLREQEARPDRGPEIVGERVGTVAWARRLALRSRLSRRRAVASRRLRRDLAITHPHPDRPEVSKAEAAAEDRGVAERGPCPGRESRGAAIDERPNRGWHEPGRVAAEPPLAIDLLERAGLAVRPGQLLDDERHALGLDVHRGRGCGLDRTAEDALQELRRFDRAEPSGPQPPDEAHPLHVGDEVHRLGDRCELVRPDRQEQEDRPIGVAPDDVPEEPEGVVVGPLDVVDEQRERADPGERRDRDAREVEGPEELGVRRQGLEPALVAPGDGLDHPPDRGLRRRPRGRVADRARGEQAARDEERPADLLVGRDRDAREPARRRELGGGEQQARLADARLALEGHRGEAAGSLVQLLGDRLELGAPPDDRAGRPAQLDRERALGPDEGVERTAVGHPEGRAMLNGRRFAQHAADYDAAALTDARCGCGQGNPRALPPHVAARSWSAYFSSDRATLASGSIRAGVHSSPQRTANAAASRSRSSIRTHAASRCGSR